MAGEAIRGAAGPLVDDPIIGHSVRAGGWADHAASSYALAARALDEGRFADAAALARHTVEEAREGYELYALWTDQIRDTLVAEGVDEAEIAAGEARLGALLAGEAGEPFDIHAGWAAYIAEIDAVEAACRAGDATGASARLESARSLWLETHDRGCDLVYGMLDLVVRHLGERRIGPLWDELMAPMYETYDVYDTATHPWPRSMHRLILIAALSLRGHLSGPGRMGAIEITEEADRWVLSFDPCGSGGRTYRDDDREGSAHAAPLRFRRDHGGPRLVLGQDRRLRLLRPLLPAQSAYAHPPLRLSDAGDRPTHLAGGTGGRRLPLVDLQGPRARARRGLYQRGL